MDHALRIEALLFYRAEPVRFQELVTLLKAEQSEVREALASLKVLLMGRGVRLLEVNDSYELVTAPEVSNLIESLRREELNRDLGKAGVETLTIILYRGPVSRAEIDFIRGVNSTFILRNLLVRGLIERRVLEKGGRGAHYVPTPDFLKYLGIVSVEELPEYGTLRSQVTAYEAKAREAVAEVSVGHA